MFVSRSADARQRPAPWVPRALGGPSVAVLLGTDHHPFDRLVRWSEELAAESTEPWFVQHGSTRLPRMLPGRRMLGGRELASLMETVDVVITHGGPGLIMEARSARHTPIVVPRDPSYGEHVDGHQVTFARHLEAEGKIHLVQSLDTLREAVELVRLMGRTTQDVSDARSRTTARFGALVDELHRDGPRSKPPRQR
jgi:UDP-N-acetylglucosamine transferase subunit ALG13